ncbi:bifunctional 2-C-methyl-D-erythritol 4-phosphate cytidylyltransferase/2-C-methyl-D-erythritol 2,4-cyclodiphosphate synthase [Croceicoccus sp. YJ47]|uniref:bifunctional 2-C-methyl-D-erythritol 4-phosphate cytidylyltransferase/2-C-methyl-D-erythritol 2,4-cyclodiphosphate synthase n=1 Tax=Croceicoccus sp. YJ47 TaxID=2798724 RepID=UPI001923858F|nr:bifunctional 2-C-methyl-D-erythritol 4-phosphate cytidylyltransferase/2-C-methyl-D-erythritol 2,4-cyclodiphosphate synthase [Croceicoccus sp. YJ47]QQN74075.1 bifunctional 2-C-methyl-D-erythritol 4-phosphate cytidylyltransferase/2-C-methyl-D-erythritol 2,4-cyclodiphosphate synthase [Croceicoccus sp. YJ47]
MRSEEQRTFAAVIVAGGSGTRAGLPVAKQYAAIGGTTMLGLAVTRMREAGADPIVVVVPAGEETTARAAIGACEGLLFTAGGRTRQESVRAGLERLCERAPSRVLIHDAARPDLPGEVVTRLLRALDNAAGAIPVLPVADSMISAEGEMRGAMLDRATLRRVQTPQAFSFAEILAAHRSWSGEAIAGDDAEVLAKTGHAVALVDGDARLRKLTWREDFPEANMERTAETIPAFRIGNGYDVHRLVPGDGLWLCGVHVRHDRALSGHSDADVALHALTDAILGAVAAGDIGQHFPPSDPQWRGAASHLFLTHAVGLARECGYRLANADLTIICERPKIGPHRDAMRARLAELVGAEIGAISVKATTTERLGFTGRGEGIAAQASVLVTRC